MRSTLGILKECSKILTSLLMLQYHQSIIAILTFHFDLVHVPGAKHGPDSLSRCPLQPGEQPDEENNDFNDWVDNLHRSLYLINPFPLPLSFNPPNTVHSFSIHNIPSIPTHHPSPLFILSVLSIPSSIHTKTPKTTKSPYKQNTKAENNKRTSPVEYKACRSTYMVSSPWNIPTVFLIVLSLNFILILLVHVLPHLYSLFLLLLITLFIFLSIVLQILLLFLPWTTSQFLLPFLLIILIFLENLPLSSSMIASQLLLNSIAL